MFLGKHLSAATVVLALLPVSGPFAVHAGVSRLFDASEFLFEAGGRFQF